MNNIVKLVILGILIAAIPITVNLVQKQQIIKSRAECPDICVQYGDPPCTGYEQVCTGYEQVCTGYEQVCNDWDEDGNCIGWGNGNCDQWGNGNCDQWGNGNCDQWGNPPCINWQPNPNCQPPPPPSNYCLEQGYNECAPDKIDTVVGECPKDGKICSNWQTYACNFEGKYYCTYACDEPCRNASCPLSGDNCVYSTSDGNCYSGKTGNTSTCAAGYPPGVCVNPTAGCNYSCGPVTCPIQTGASPSPSRSPVASRAPIPGVSKAPIPGVSKAPAPSSPTGGNACKNNIGFQSPDLGVTCTSCIASNKSGLATSIKNLNPNLFTSCSDKEVINYWCNGGISAEANTECSKIKSGVCVSQCGVAPASSPTPTPGGVFTTKFRIAEDPTSLAAAPWQDYTTTVASTPFDYTFKDQTPGPKSIFVEFEDSAGKKVKHTAHIKLLGPDPAMTNCSLSFENNSTVLNLTGQNFGTTKGSVKSGETNLQVREWKETSIKAVWQNTPIGQTIPVSLTTSDGQTGDGQCGSISQLSLGAKVFCRAPSNHDIDNVDLTLVGAYEGGEKVKQKIKIDKDGIIQGLTQKLEAGRNYKLSLKAPRSLRRAVSFTAGPGTINISNFVLPIGDIFPVDGGDNVVNGFDKAELNRQFIISQDACSRSGDFNKDCRVNSIDWACMRYDFGKSDDSEPIPGPMPTPVPSASLSPSPSPASIPQQVAWWKFDEGTGTTANDSSGNNTGTINGAIWTAGRNSQALSFNGTSDYVGGASSASLNEIRSAVTLAAWVKPASTIAGWTDRGIISKNNTSESFELTHYSSQADVDAFAGFVSIGGDEKWAIGTTSPVPNTWYNVVLTYDGSQVKIYVNGRLENSEAATGPIDTNIFNFAIGARNGTTGMRPFQGVIDDARIYNFALTATEISNLYNTAPQ